MSDRKITHKAYLLAILDTRGWVPTVRQVVISSEQTGSRTIACGRECPAELRYSEGDSFHQAADRMLDFLASSNGSLFFGWTFPFLNDRDKKDVQQRTFKREAEERKQEQRAELAKRLPRQEGESDIAHEMRSQEYLAKIGAEPL